jgi:hypothetical protein
MPRQEGTEVSVQEAWEHLGEIWAPSSPLETRTGKGRLRRFQRCAFLPSSLSTNAKTTLKE